MPELKLRPPKGRIVSITHSKDEERFFDCAAARPKKQAAEERGHFAQNDNFRSRSLSGDLSYNFRG
jgi:hypothetical protein